jgi:DNA-binding IclR family transcriptional regulator
MAIDLATQMRQPGRYRLGAAILRMAFGVTPRQRVQPIAEELERLTKNRKKSASAVVAATGIAAGLAVIAFGLSKGNFGLSKGKK